VSGSGVNTLSGAHQNGSVLLLTQQQNLRGLH
jgi:hypothetical protein